MAQQFKDENGPLQQSQHDAEHQERPVDARRSQPGVTMSDPNGFHQVRVGAGREDQPTSDRPEEGAHGDAHDPAQPHLPKTDDMSQAEAERVRWFPGMKFPSEAPDVFDPTGPAPPTPVPPVEPLETELGKRDRSAKQQHQVRQDRLDRLYNDMHKRLNGKLHQREVAEHGPQGEARSAALIERVELIKLQNIVDDPRFQNFRLATDEEELRALAESMRLEGLKEPVTVVEAPGDKGEFLLRNGFRRTTAARLLGWKEIPAIVLPKDTPVIEEKWTNIIENTARINLWHYEIANAAKTMRDEHGVSASDFAARAGYTESYIWKLLRCIDRLPAAIIEQWRAKSPIPVDLLAEWTALSPTDAIEQFRIFAAQRPKGTKQYMPSPRERIKNSRLMTATNYGLKRMHRARFAIEVAQDLDEKTRSSYLYIVDYCMGARETIPGIFDPATKQRMYKSRKKGDPKMPGPADADDAGESSSGKKEDK